MNLPPMLRAWMRRLSRPLPAAAFVCAAGLACAAFAIGVNRIVASRPLTPIPVITPQTSRASPTVTPAATPSSSPAAHPVSCAGSDQATGRLNGLVVAPAQVALTDGENTLDVTVPAGALVDGRGSDVHVQAGSAGAGSQPLSGTLVQSAMLCVQSGAQLLQVDVPNGAQVDGSAMPGASGAQAQDLHFRVQSSSD